MKIQYLAVIFIIIILPMSLVFSEYMDSQMKTIKLQNSYDSKLLDSTYDAIKAFQMNTLNDSTSDLANAKIRNLNASVQIFYNSLADNFSMSGYSKETLSQFVPAVVFTLYDGYYIYSPYTNTLDSNDNFNEDATYTNGEIISDLKPYVYYSCRYVKGNIDVVITYSLDTYVTIKGTNGTDVIDLSGYLLTGANETGEGVISYREITIDKEDTLKSNLLQKIVNRNSNEDDSTIGSFSYKKVNGVRYFKDENEKVFTVLNGQRYNQKEARVGDKDDSAQQYYKQAVELKKQIRYYGLNDLRVSNAVDINGNSYGEQTPFSGDFKIFGELYDEANPIEKDESDFNVHRLEVIKNAIESNLSVAISNYNSYSGKTDIDFQMPKLKATDWEKIYSNVSMISFLQGLSIGGKTYNGYAIVSSNKNEEFVSEDSIYIIDGTDSKDANRTYYKVLDQELLNNNNNRGVFNMDLEKRTALINGQNQYYYYQNGLGSYTSIITSNGIDQNQSIYGYFSKDGNGGQEILEEKKDLAKIYYTALGRERYSMYRVTNKLEDVQEQLSKSE